MTAANLVLYGDRSAYALCRPPGHHAGRDFSGGYCYFNNTAIAAKILSVRGSVAVIDIDYHHGNGTQDIFWEDDRVLTVSIHCDPRMDYPYFVGFADEVGAGAGEGYNLNIPLPPGATGEWYQKALELAFDRIHLFDPWALVIAVGFDTYRDDPISKFDLRHVRLCGGGPALTRPQLADGVGSGRRLQHRGVGEERGDVPATVCGITVEKDRETEG